METQTCTGNLEVWTGSVALETAAWPEVLRTTVRTAKMALPTLSARWRGRWSAEQQIARQREQEARLRRDWERHRRYLHDTGVCTAKQAQWSSRSCFQRRWAGPGGTRPTLHLPRPLPLATPYTPPPVPPTALATPSH